MESLISERIIKRRNELNMNQKELAKKAGLKQPMISQYENNKRIPTHESLEKLAKALEINADFLWSGIEREQVVYDHKDEELINLLRLLNPEEKERLIDFGRYMASKKGKDGERINE